MVALKTFQNLDVNRQQEIIRASLEEFALHEYQTASLSGIIARLGLAKGSFYRYFENKQSLYFYLLEHCLQLRLDSDKEHTHNTPKDLYELVVQHFTAKIHFDKKYPLQSAFLYNVMQEKNNEELGNIQLESKRKITGVIKKTVTEWVKAKKLRGDIDADALAYTIMQTQVSIFDYICMKHNIDFRENIRATGKLHGLPDSKIINTTRQFVSMLLYGIAAK